MPIFDQFGLPPLQNRYDPLPMPNQFRQSMSIPQYPEIRTPSLDAFRNFLSEVPDRSQYQPSKWRRLAAAIGGVGAGWNKGGEAGFNLAQNIVEAPYMRALQDWSVKGRGLQEAAEIEQRNVGAENNAWRNFANALLGSRRADIQENRYGTLADQGNRRLGIQEGELQVKKDLAKARVQSLTQGKWEIVSDRDGKDYFYNPTTRESVPANIDFYGKPEEVVAQTERALTTAGIYAGASRERTGVMRDRLDFDRERLDVDEPTRPVTPARERLDLQNTLRDMALENPKWVNQFIGQRNGNYYIIAPTEQELQGGWFSSGKGDEFSKFQAEFQRRQGGGNTTTPTRRTTPTPTRPSPQTGTTIMTGPDGAMYNIPNHLVEQAIKDGFKRGR